AELERLLARADAAGETRLSYDLRIALIQIYRNHHDQWRLVPAFAWCLATFDRRPELFDKDDAEWLRWYHKDAVITLCDYSRVELAKTMATLDDMERRYREGGHSLSAVYNLRCRIAIHLGDEAAVEKWYRLWRAARRDENSDCAACEPTRWANMMTWRGRYQEAVEVLAPVIAGTVGCAAQPERALCAAMEPLLRTGQHAQAAAAHVRSYRRHRYDPGSFEYLSDHLRFCVLSGNQERGWEILAEHLGGLDRPDTEISAMQFSAAAALVARRMVETGRGAQTVHRPVWRDRPAADLTAEQLLAVMTDQARQMARRFDARNGTDAQSRRVEQYLNERPVVESVQLPPYQPAGTTAAAAPPEAGVQDVLAPLTSQAIVAVLNERGDSYRVDDDGSVGGRWEKTTIWFYPTGGEGHILQARSLTERRFPSQREAALYEFCNSWNRDRLIPTAYVYQHDDGTLGVVGDHCVDLRPGVTGRQLHVLVADGIDAAVELAQDVAGLDNA
ncbi:MAG: YbjN domain-containing protein, partial [Micromonosporaceae bacterium]|nr:YbjN domain-containing protein [Micromonosporaceae bacterium]